MPKGKQGFQKGHKFFGDLINPNYFHKGEHNGVEFGNGQERTENWKKIVSELVGEKRYNWKGDDVGYHSLHAWVIRHKGNPKCCEHCGIKGEMLKRAWSIEWANIDHRYCRVLEDYIGLCNKCHAEYDVKNNLRKYKNAIK